MIHPFRIQTATILLTSLSFAGCLSPTENGTSFPADGRYVLETIGSLELPTPLGTPDGAQMVADTLEVSDGPGGDEPTRSVRRFTTVRINSANVVRAPEDYRLVIRAVGLLLFRNCESLENCDPAVTARAQVTQTGVSIEGTLFAQLGSASFRYRKLP